MMSATNQNTPEELLPLLDLWKSRALMLEMQLYSASDTIHELRHTIIELDQMKFDLWERGLKCNRCGEPCPSCINTKPSKHAK